MARVAGEEGLPIAELTVLDRRASAVDPFVKYLLRAEDGAIFETVRIPLLAPRWSVCISTQAGCGLGCVFCETGRLGFGRNLTAEEMVAQVEIVRREAAREPVETRRPVTGAVFQGQGEPLQNYDNVMTAIAALRRSGGPQIGGDRITISTVGILPAIERYIEDGHPYRLILSLTSAIPERRARLLPVASRYAVEDLAGAMKRLAERQRNVVALGWVMIAGENTGEDEAEALALLFAGSRVRLSLIDVNDPSGRFLPPDDDERNRFLDALTANKIPFKRRYSGGGDIRAACGTLASTACGGRAL